MKRIFAGFPCLLLFLFCFSGCSGVGEKSASLSIIYGTAAVLSLALLVGCCLLVRRKRSWFITLFSCVMIVNIGYTFLAVSANLEMALWANRISYLGSVFLPLSMLMILLEVTNKAHGKALPRILLGVAVVMFFIAASPGILPIYYEEVSFAVVDGVSTLVKVYGPLHPMYLVYLLGYFAAMVGIIIRANIQKTIDSTAHAIIIAIAVFVNIGVWFIEQLVSIDFEMLSVSYIISELFLLGVHLVMTENQKLRDIVTQATAVSSASGAEGMLDTPIETDAIAPERIELFMAGLSKLTPTEKTVYDAYIARVTTKELMASMNIKESTLKYHNRNLYGKLGVSSRKELLELHKHLRAMQTKVEDTYNQ